MDPSVYRGKKIPIDIHIGLAKTGTTAIQRYLQLNREVLLRDHGVLFPRSLGANLSANLAAACQLSEQPDDLRRVRQLGTPEEVAAYFELLQQQFGAELEQESPGRVLVSCEHLSSRLADSSEIQKLQTFLAPFSTRIRIVIYLRRQDEFFLSLYSTAVKSGSTVPFCYPQQKGLRHDFYFSQLLQRWSEIFAVDQILVRVYERSRFDDGDIVADFCELLQLPGDLERPPSDHNNSLNSNLLNFFREFNELVPRFVSGRLNPLRADIVPALAALNFPGGKHLSGGDSVEFYQRFTECNRAVSRQWLADDASVPEDLFSDSPENGGPEPLELLNRRQLVEVSAGLWRYSQQQMLDLRAERDLLRAELFLERGDLKKARSQLTGLTEKHPQLWRPCFLLAKLCRLEGDNGSARELARRAGDINPSCPEICRFIDSLEDSFE